MKTPIFCLVCLLLAAPALADVRDVSVPVGPYGVNVDKLNQLNHTIRLRGSITGGANCETLELAVFLRNAEEHARALVTENLRRYDAAWGARIDAETRHERGGLKERRGWYIDNIVIRCVNDGVAARHESRQ